MTTATEPVSVSQVFTAHFCHFHFKADVKDVTVEPKPSTEQVVIIEEDKDSFQLLEEEILRGKSQIDFYLLFFY